MAQVAHIVSDDYEAIPSDLAPLSRALGSGVKGSGLGFRAGECRVLGSLRMGAVKGGIKGSSRGSCREHSGRPPPKMEIGFKVEHVGIIRVQTTWFSVFFVVLDQRRGHAFNAVAVQLKLTA